MKSKLLALAAVLFILILFVAGVAEAQNQNIQNTPFQNLQKIKDYNRTVAESTLRNVSFLIAFLGGILSFLAPCTVALFPAFLATTASSRRSLTVEMLLFFAGFALAFVSIGVVLTSLGEISFVTFQRDASLLVQTAGIILVFLGFLMFFGKGFSFIRLGGRLPKDAVGTFLFGALFAVGWSACIGPIIAGIFTMAAVLRNYAYTALLLFFYALGLAVPLFVAAFAYDRFNLANSRLLQGFNLTLKVGKTELLLTSSGMVSGMLMVFLGLFFIFNGGTTAITAADLLAMIALLAAIFTVAWFFHRFVIVRLISSANARKIAAVAEILAGIAMFAFVTRAFNVRTTGLTERLSNALLENTKSFSIVAGATLAMFVAALFYFVRSQLKGGKK